MSSLLKVCMDVGHISKPVPGLLHQFVYFLPMALLVYPIFGLYICLIVSNKERSKNSLLTAKRKVPNQKLKNNCKKRGFLFMVILYEFFNESLTSKIFQ